MIGNMRTAALISMEGSIDWFCYPNFDSPSVFGALLDDEKGGSFQICAVGDGVKHKQLYWPSTNVLVTRFLLGDGIAEIEDFMPVGMPADSPLYHHLYRRVRCVKGSVRFKVHCRPAFDYGRKEHRVHLNSVGVEFRCGDLTLSLATTVRFHRDRKGGITGEFVLDEGKWQTFRLSGWGDERHQPASDEEIESLFQGTVGYWRSWLAACTYRGRWRQQVERSALVLKMLTFEPTGAIIAAPTTSLPEVIGGERNWDYRYTWFRDAAFTVYAFLRIGFKSEATAFMGWMSNYGVKHHRPRRIQELPTVRPINGQTLPPEETLDHWKGYCDSKPVRIGNAADAQFQNDIYGEVLDAVYLHNKYVTPVSYDVWLKIRRRLNWICKNWSRPDAGIWEVRNRPRHFVYSKAMNWVALDRGLRLAEKRALPSDKEKWIRERDRIYEQVMTKGWSSKLQSFVQSYGSEELDASVLMLPLVFFVAPTDPRMIGTLKALTRSPREGGLVSDGLVYRYRVRKRSLDGLTGDEGTFNMCTFLLVEALTRTGRAYPDNLAEARLIFERMLGYANHLGLYAEQTGPRGEALGNFPQAFTHLALISAAFNLDRALDESS